MSRVRRILLVAFPVVVLPLVFIFDVVRSAVDLEISWLSYARDGLVALVFVSMYLNMEDRRKGKKGISTKEIGRLLMVSVLALGAAGALTFIRSSVPAEGQARFGVTALVILAATLGGTVLGYFAISALLTMKDLVLFKRRKGTRRIFVIFVVLQIATAAVYLPLLSPLGGVPATLLFSFTILAGVINAFKQNWIVYLSRREKIFSIIYSALLFIVLLLMDVILAQNSGGTRALEAFSRPLLRFVETNSVVATIYFGMAFVSTLFHLPTAEVFERKQSELNSLHNLGRLVTQVLDFNELVETVTEMTTEVCGAKSAWLELLREGADAGRSDVVSCHGISRDQIEAFSGEEDASFRKLVLESRKVVLVDDVRSDRRTKSLSGLVPLDRSLLSIPLMARGELVGILHATKEEENGFDQDDIDVMTTFADQAAIAIENSRLIAKSIERERLQREIELAQRMQRRLLPQGMPQIDGVDISAISVSSLEVGGDYYDFVPLSNDRYGIAVGDVSGKGVSAAFYMAEVKGILLSLSKVCSSPRELLVRANKALVDSLEKNAFISFMYAILDAQAEEIVLARAGHCPLLYLTASGAELVRPTGLGLGLTSGEIFEQSTEERILRLHAGDVCVLYTDGVTEARNEAGDEFGTERLVSASKEAQTLTGREIRDRILEAIRTFTGHDSYNDDMTLVVIKWCGRDKR